MKQKYFSQVLIGAFLLSMLTACGGGGGGGGPVALATGTFTKTVEIAAATINYSQLFSIAAVENRYMFLLTAADINGSGKVRSVRFKYTTSVASAFTCPSTTIKMGATTVATLSATYASNVNQGAGSFTTVLNNAAVTIPAGSAGSYFNIDVATPFDYNGKDNLIVEVTRTAACTGDVSVSTVGTGGYNGVVWAAGAAGTSTIAAGTAQPNSMHMQLVFAGGETLVIAADRAGNNSNFYAPADVGRAQYLILASDIVGSGPVSGIQFTANSALAAPMTATYKLTFSHVAPATTTLGTTFASNVGSGATVVAQAVTVSLNTGTTEWWVPLTGSFNYDGTSNLLVDVEATAVTGGFTLRYQNSGGTRIIANVDPAAATGSALGPRGLEPKLRFHGAPVAKLSANTHNNNAIFNGPNSTATLYSATDLGTAGSITSVSCRLRSTPIPASYANFKVVMGHSTVSTLSGTAATDFVSQSTVFSGTVVIPAGLTTGDWIDIPLSSAFAYDGKRNLIVWMGNGGAASGTAVVNVCQAESNATRYPGGLGLTTAGVGSASYTLIDWTTDIRMTIQK